MSDTLLLRYQQPIEAEPRTPPVPSGTTTFTRVDQESGDTDCSLAFGGPVAGTGTFTATKTEAPDRDYASIGSEFVFPH